MEMVEINATVIRLTQIIQFLLHIFLSISLGRPSIVRANLSNSPASQARLVGKSSSYAGADDLTSAPAVAAIDRDLWVWIVTCLWS